MNLVQAIVWLARRARGRRPAPFLDARPGAIEAPIAVAPRRLEPDPPPATALFVGVPTQGRLTSRFGKRRHPVLGGTRLHKGVDLAAPTGTPVWATSDGTVQFVGTQQGYGRCLELAHGGGRTSFYAHLSAVHVGRGQRVTAGQVIGLVGATGRVTGPHLHYEVRRNGEAVDPGIH